MINSNMNMNFTKIEVGKSFKEGVYRYQEGVHFNFSESGASLVLFFNSPTKQEIENIRKGKIKIALKEIDEILFILIKFGTLNWMDAPFNMNLCLSPIGDMQEPTEGLGYLLNTILIDASNGIVKVMRANGLSTEFSKEFKKAVQLQSHLPFDENAYKKKIDYLNKHKTTKDLVAQAITIYEITSTDEKHNGEAKEATMKLKNEELIRKSGLEGFIRRGKRYHSALPLELEEGYCYTIDGGHSIIVVLENIYIEGEPIEGFLVTGVSRTPRL